MLLAINVFVNSCLLCSFVKKYLNDGNDAWNIEHIV